MGVFSDPTNTGRFMFAVFSYENWKEGISSPFHLPTQMFDITAAEPRKEEAGFVSDPRLSARTAH